jgi:hypothetical protein
LATEEDSVPLPRLTLTSNAEWLGIIDRVLAGDREARVTLWVQVGFYVERVVALPHSALNKDDKARRRIAFLVMIELEGKSFAKLKEWRNRQARKRDHASWWRWIQMLSRSVAIDYLRVQTQSVTRRDASSDRPDRPKPQAEALPLLHDTPDDASSHPTQPTEAMLYELLARFQSTKNIDESTVEITEVRRTAFGEGTMTD